MLARISDRYGFDIPADRLKTFRALIGQTLGSYARLEELVEPSLSVRYPGQPGHRPSATDNPLGARSWKTEEYVSRPAGLHARVAGGAAIITTVLQVFLNEVEHGMDLPEAIAALRIFSASYSSLAWEEGIDPAVLDALHARGHQPAASATVIGSIQAALGRPDGIWVAPPTRDARGA